MKSVKISPFMANGCLDPPASQFPCITVDHTDSKNRLNGQILKVMRPRHGNRAARSRRCFAGSLRSRKPEAAEEGLRKQSTGSYSDWLLSEPEAAQPRGSTERGGPPGKPLASNRGRLRFELRSEPSSLFSLSLITISFHGQWAQVQASSALNN